MITYAERACFGPRHLALLSRAEDLVSRVSDAWGNELRCHELARAVCRVLADPTLRVLDGKCGPVEHSWIVLPYGAILDPYVPGRLPSVQIVDPIVGAAYRVGVPRDDIREAFVERLVAEMRSPAAPSAKKKQPGSRRTRPQRAPGI